MQLYVNVSRKYIDVMTDCVSVHCGGGETAYFQVGE